MCPISCNGLTFFLHSFSQSPDIPLDILKQPTFTNDKTVELSAIGTTPLSYQWFCDEERLTDGESYEGSTTPKLVIKIAESVLQGCYKCRIEDKHGKVASSNEIGKNFKPFYIECVYVLLCLVDIFNEKLKCGGLKKTEIHKLRGWLHSSLAMQLNP